MMTVDIIIDMLKGLMLMVTYYTIIFSPFWIPYIIKEYERLF